MTRHPRSSETPGSFSAAGYPHQGLTGKIIASAHHVDNELGFGFLESVYRRALATELNYRGVTVAQEVPFELFHRGVQSDCFAQT
jgi:GxxExxY protein